MPKYVIKNPNEPASQAQISALAKKFSWVRGKKNFALERQVYCCLSTFANPKQTKKAKLFTKAQANLLFSKDIKVLPKIYKDAITLYLKNRK